MMICDLCKYSSFHTLGILYASGPEGRGDMNKYANWDTRKEMTSLETKH
jgi:hypothetical protein